MEIGARTKNKWLNKDSERFSYGLVKSILHVIIVLGVQTQTTFLQKHIQISRQQINFYLIYCPNKHSDRQTIFNIFHENIIKNGTTMQTKHLQEQKEK